MNKYLFIVVIVTGSILCSCHKQDSVIGPTTVLGKFVIDSIGTTAYVKVDSITKVLKMFIAFSSVYHFENYPGTLDNISLAIADSIGIITSIDYTGPESLNEIHRFNDVYKLPGDFSDQDSIKIVRGLSGEFWTKNSKNGYDFIDSFSWKDSLYIHIVR